jgi:hypothetical protein
MQSRQFQRRYAPIASTSPRRNQHMRVEMGRVHEYSGTSLIRNSAPLGPYRRTMPRALWWSWGGACLLSARYSCTSPRRPLRPSRCPPSFSGPTDYSQVDAPTPSVQIRQLNHGNAPGAHTSPRPSQPLRFERGDTSPRCLSRLGRCPPRKPPWSDTTAPAAPSSRGFRVQGPGLRVEG